MPDGATAETRFSSPPRVSTRLQILSSSLPPNRIVGGLGRVDGYRAGKLNSRRIKRRFSTLPA
jgi:hypothetical protein